ncbi:hypothetical protein FB451DRAFT_1307315 [Mycena latifolia]|nr:hypothetical protein FB451DRAFT_1307315 [Mycena latifolia]
MFKWTSTQKIWVYAFRLWHMWVYCCAIPEAQRTAVQDAVVKEYYMPNWVGDALTAISKQPEENDALLKRFPDLGVTNISYNPDLRGAMIQYREFALKGCKFQDDVWTLCMCLVRGLSLFEQLGMQTEKYTNPDDA